MQMKTLDTRYQQLLLPMVVEKQVNMCTQPLLLVDPLFYIPGLQMRIVLGNATLAQVPLLH